MARARNRSSSKVSIFRSGGKASRLKDRQAHRAAKEAERARKRTVRDAELNNKVESRLKSKHQKELSSIKRERAAYASQVSDLQAQGLTQDEIYERTTKPGNRATGAGVRLRRNSKKGKGRNKGESAVSRLGFSILGGGSGATQYNFKDDENQRRTLGR